MSSKIYCECRACRIETCRDYFGPCSCHNGYRAHHGHSNKSCTAADVRRVSKAHNRGRNESRKNSLSLRTFVWRSSRHPVHHILCTGLPRKSADIIYTVAPSDRRRRCMSNTTVPIAPDLHPADRVWGRRICILGPPYLRLHRHTDHRSGRWYMVCKSHYSGSPWHPDNRNIIFSSAVVCPHTSWGIYPGSKVCNTHNSPTELPSWAYVSSCTIQYSGYAVSHYPCHPLQWTTIRRPRKNICRRSHH